MKMYNLILKCLFEEEARNRISLDESLVDFGKEELERVGLFDKDSDYEGMLGNSVMELLQTFSKQGHSGFSAQLTMEIFDKLIRYEPLSPITNDPDEWSKVVDEIAGPKKPLWQSKRNPACFSNDGGITHYNVDEPDKLITSEQKELE